MCQKTVAVVLLIAVIAATGIVGLPQAVSLEGSTVPCTEQSCGTECGAAASAAAPASNATTHTFLCNKSTGMCSCCVLPECEMSCQQRKRKERPRSKEVRSKCTDKGECYCNFIFFDVNDNPMGSSSS